MDDTELMASIGRMVVNAALLEFAVAELVAITEGCRDEARLERATAIAVKPGEARRLFKRLAKQCPEFAWFVEDAQGLLNARHFAAHSIAQQDAIAEGGPALFVLSPKSGGETMITAEMAMSNARMILEGHERIRGVIAAVNSGAPLSPPPRYQSGP